jgi:hypothetical protein
MFFVPSNLAHMLPDRQSSFHSTGPTDCKNQENFIELKNYFLKSHFSTAFVA